jgi:hypothetical protein
LKAVVERADNDVVPEFGVPGPISDGVTGSDGGGGRLIKVGVDIALHDSRKEPASGYFIGHGQEARSISPHNPKSMIETTQRRGYSQDTKHERGWWMV